MHIFKSLRLGIINYWLGVGMVICIIGAIIIVLNIWFGIPIQQAVIVVGSLSTAVGVFLAFLTLHNTHEWNRRHYTVVFFDDWNERGRKHLAVLEKQFPDFFAVPDIISKPEIMESWCIDKNLAKKIVEAKSEPQVPCTIETEIRGHLIELLNYFEGIATAYEQYVVDRVVIEESVGTVILNVWVYFQPAIDEFRKAKRRDPWPPLSRVVELWMTEAIRSKAQAQAEEASQRHENALKKSKSKLKKQTGI